jgi:PAS domain S-box-containing protein
VVYASDGTVLGDSGIVVSKAEDRSSKVVAKLWCKKVVKPKVHEVSLVVRDDNRTLGTIKLSVSQVGVEQALAQTGRVILAGALLVSAVLSFMVVMLTRNITRPLNYLNRVVKGIVEGNLSIRAKVSSYKEINDLAISLNAVAEILETYADQLSEEQDKIKVLLASTSDGIIITDKEGVITLASNPAGRLFGLCVDSLVGMQVRDIASAEEIADLIWSALTENKIIRKEVKTSFPAERILNFFVSPTHNKEGDVIGSVCVLQDISEARRQAEIKKDFVANVSHELRTPVASIRAIVGALQSGALDDPAIAARFVSSLDAETQRLSLLLNDLLNLSELESGKVRRRCAVVDLYEVVNEVVESLSDKIRQNCIFVSVDVPVGLTIKADRVQIFQVLQNLIDNAVKYTESGGSVTITAMEMGAEVRFSVQDTGVGIPPTDLDRIFERFYRVDKARSRQLGGTGLGLSIVKDIVESYNGRVIVQSELGKGSTFTVVLPKNPFDTSASQS